MDKLLQPTTFLHELGEMFSVRLEGRLYTAGAILL